MPTISDILKELEKPGRDPRPEFTTTFKEGVEETRDLCPDMILEGVVTNVAAFGALLIEIDGLVHIRPCRTRLRKRSAHGGQGGQVVRVKVLEVDEKQAHRADHA